MTYIKTANLMLKNGSAWMTSGIIVMAFDIKRRGWLMGIIEENLTTKLL